MTDALEKLRDNITNADVSLLLSGLPVIDAWLYRFSRDDSKTLTPLSILLIMVATLLVFRRFSAMVMPIVVVAFALVWAFGLMGILGLKLNIISATLTAIILAVGIADSIHVLADFYHEKEKGLNNYDATISSISSLLVPCFFTSATTIAGMLSLSVSQLKPIGEFGWLAGFGVFSAFFLSITIGPILLVYLEGPDNPESQSQSRITPFLLNLVRSTKSKAVGIVGMALLFFGNCGMGILPITGRG